MIFTVLHFNVHFNGYKPTLILALIFVIKKF